MKQLEVAAKAAPGLANAIKGLATQDFKVSSDMIAPRTRFNRKISSGRVVEGRSVPLADIKAIRQAVAYHRQSKSKKAIATINKAIAARPNDPFLRDLKGEILMQSRQFKSAASAYAQGQKQAPREALILAGYGRALLASGQVKPALTALERARSIDYRDGIMLRDLATAYAKTGQRGMAALVTAERYALRGRLKDAGIHAKRASDLLARGSGPWQRAQDVLLASERFAKKRK